MDTSLNKNLERLAEIKEAFAMFSYPLDMIAQLIDIGKDAHNMTDNEKIDGNMIRGCTSRAWMIITESSNDNYNIKTDSDSHIVSGLLFLLSLSANNQSKSFINNIDGIQILNSVGLDGHITSQRTNGFLSAVETLKKRIN